MLLTICTTLCFISKLKANHLLLATRTKIADIKLCAQALRKVLLARKLIAQVSAGYCALTKGSRKAREITAELQTPAGEV